MVFFKIKKIILAIFSLQVFFLGAFTIVTSQAIVKFIFKSDVVKQQKWINNTKKRFVLLLLVIFQIVAPSRIRISSDSTNIDPATFKVDPVTGRLVSQLSETSVMIANHQIYTDWVFLWWLAYTGKLAGSVIIMLKKSLGAIPILGYGMRNYNFIFLSRKWALDKINLHKQLSDVNANALGSGSLCGAPNGGNKLDEKWPYSLIVFPEGTNISANTRNKSEVFAKKIDCPPYKHVLVPHTTGLREILLKLRESCKVVYDISIGYSGVRSDEYGQDIYKIGDVFMKGQMPKLVDLHIRSFNVSDIPIDDEKEFTAWLFKVWAEKDSIMDHYYKQGNFNLTRETTSVESECSVSLWEYFYILVLPVSLILVVIALIINKII